MSDKKKLLKIILETVRKARISIEKNQNFKFGKYIDVLAGIIYGLHPNLPPKDRIDLHKKALGFYINLDILWALAPFAKNKVKQKQKNKES